MNLKKICTVILFTLIGITGVNAEILTNASNEVYSLQLNDGGYAWSEVTSNLGSNATDITSVRPTYTNSIDRSRDTVIEVTPAQVGVAGSVDVYDVRTETTTNHTDTVNTKSETSDINFSGSTGGAQTSSSQYMLTGSILRNSQFGVLDGGFGSFGISAGMDVSYLGESPYVPESMTGTVTIDFESGINRWSTSHQQDFLSGNSFLSLSDSHSFDLDDTIFFTAIFAIDGPSLSYAIDDISLYAYTRDSASTLLNRDIEVLFDEQKTLFLSEEIPALEPPTAVPLPAAVWLLGSGLLALVSVARRRS